MASQIDVELFEAIKKKFFENLERKTNWGKEQVKMEYVNAVADASVIILQRIIAKLP
jgi:ketosteroid isomerase-like protein